MRYGHFHSSLLFEVNFPYFCLDPNHIVEKFRSILQTLPFQIVKKIVGKIEKMTLLFGVLLKIL